MQMKKLFLLKVLIITFVVFLSFQTVRAVTYNVITPVANVSQPGSLPWCIAQANTTTTPDIIQFVHAQSMDPAANSITVHATLVITYPVFINGNQIKVAADNLGPQTCFQLQASASGSTITGLAIVDSNYGISINVNSDHHLIYNNRIGTDWSDTTGLGNNYGIYCLGKYVSIGWNGLTDRNVISGNTTIGIWLQNGGMRNQVVGNYIGVNNDGSAALGTQPMGIYINASRENRIGGDRPSGLGNVISNHSSYGIIFEGAAASGNTVCGNTIGLNLNMNTALPNDRGVAGVSLEGNFIGLPISMYENTIAGNTSHNINFWAGSGPRPKNNVIQNNFIGTDPANGAYANNDGIYLNDCDNNLIGGNRNSMEGNVISGNDGNTGGVWVIGNGNSICGNYVGTTVDGTAALQNAQGISVTGFGNLIGGPNSMSGNYGNVLSGNLYNGILLAGGDGNTIVGNTIGLNAAGDAAVANQNSGVFINAAAQNCLIGGSTVERNIISGNTMYGINFSSTAGHVVANNYFGCNAAGDSSLLNVSGAMILNNSFQNMIENNVSVQNISLTNSSAFGNTLVGNVIGVYPDQSPVVGLSNGIYLNAGAHGNFIGLKQTGSGNLVANTTNGITVSGATTLNNGIFGNTITAFSNAGILLSSGGNYSYAYPEIHMADTAQGVSGVAQNNDYIEVFIAENKPGSNGGAMSFLGYTTADGSGNWSIPGGGFAAGNYICATASDGINDSSMLGENFLAVGPPATQTTTPTSTATPTPTLTHSATTTPTASITTTATPTPQVTATPTSTITPSATPTNSLAQVVLKGKFVLPYPNPSNEEMKFVIHLEEAADIKLLIYNFSGERIASMAYSLSVGQGQTLAWDCKSVAAGLYLLRVLKDGKLIETQKIAIVH